MSKNRLRQKVDMIFDQVHAHPMHKKLHELPAFLRYLISFFLLIFGIIAFLTPIPGGIIILIVALSLILGFQRVKVYIIRCIYLFGIDHLYERIHNWIEKKKNQ